MHKSVRQRRVPNTSDDIASEEEENEDRSDEIKPSARILSKLVGRRTVAIVFLLFIVLYVNFPRPSLSKEAQQWRDSGYMYHFDPYNVFYKDIVTLQQSEQPNVVSEPVLLIIHGYPTSGYDWKDLIPALQVRFGRIIVPDLLGLGFSDKPTGHLYNTMEQATIIERLVAFLDVAEVHILAHDYGDTVTQELVARRLDDPEHDGFTIRSICLSNGGILPSSYQPLLIQKLMIMPGLNLIAGRLSNWFLFKNRMSVLFGPTSKPSRALLRDFYGIVRHNDGNLVLPLIMGYLRERQVNEKRWVSALQRTNVPLHLIYGPHDPINTPERFLVAYKKQMANSGISVLENTGHYPQVEDPEGFVEYYNTFLDELGREL